MVGPYSGYFCRFAIRNYRDCDSFDITPLNSHLLRFRRDYWKKPRYRHPCKPAVFDLTPNVLGPAEGLTQASFDIYAGLGFDRAHHMTWKVSLCLLLDLLQGIAPHILLGAT